MVPNFNRFTDKAQKVGQGAVDTARRLGHDAVGTEHLLLAIYRDSAYGAAKILDELGQTRERVRSTLLEGLERIIRERARR